MRVLRFLLCTVTAPVLTVAAFGTAVVFWPREAAERPAGLGEEAPATQFGPSWLEQRAGVETEPKNPLSPRMTRHAQPVRGIGTRPPAGGLLAQSDFAYLGAFRTPPADAKNKWSFPTPGLAYNPSDNTLFVANKRPSDNAPGAAKISIPTLVGGSNTSLLNRASVRIAWSNIYTRVPDTTRYNRIGGFHVHNNKLVWTRYNYYELAGTETLSHGYSSLDLTSNSVMHQVGSNTGTQKARKLAGCMCDIPTVYQSSFGKKPCLTGLGGVSILSTSNDGPGAYSFDPDQLGVFSPVPVTTYIQYGPGGLDPASNTKGNGPNAVWVATNHVSGMFLHSSGGKRGLCFICFRGNGRYWYGFQNYGSWRGSAGFPTAGDIPALKPGKSHYGTLGAPSGWPATDTEGRYYSDSVAGVKGPHAPPYSIAVYVYDPDAVAAAGGPGNLRPAAIFDLPMPAFPVYGWDDNAGITGATYDSANRKLYTAIGNFYDGLEPSPLILVHQLP